MVRPCSLRPRTPPRSGMTESRWLVARGADVDEENGTLVVLPGLHKQGTLALEETCLLYTSELPTICSV